MNDQALVAELQPREALGNGLPELVALHLPAFLQEHSQVHLHALEDQVQHQCAAEDVKQLHHIWVVQPFQERDLAHGTDWNAVVFLQHLDALNGDLLARGTAFGFVHGAIGTLAELFMDFKLLLDGRGIVLHLPGSSQRSLLARFLQALHLEVAVGDQSPLGHGRAHGSTAANE
eukprot:CAMPEP_0181407862 /NCGR_PEP_ID=MMETSP1110-20121109/5997_1 /TAXON_ID=174948 /ORGANISM="Symbiodinium sp., Strain CCMP421" /LENGTH=173 /DNA_ID=CAMNT_0023530301 /DNA_START=538 /DNA_END=1059 /DNA_ORIENTATION=-